MEKLRMTSPDLSQANIDKLAELFPSVITEAVDASGDIHRAVDFDLLRQELSRRVVEGPQERYRLDWPGKRASAFAANTPIAKTLRPVREDSVDFDATRNIFVEGDNLDALKLLQESYLGKVKLIYIDPPYNTGNDFVYNDDFAETSDDYLRRSGQADDAGSRLVANTEANGRYHSDWLSMLYPRLKLARNLLSDDGVVVISIDDGEHAGVVEVCKELFGARNYIASVARVTKRTSNKGIHFAPSKDYLVVVARNADALGPFMDDIPDEYRKKFAGLDDRGSFATVGLYQASLDPMRGCSNQRYWIEAPDGTFLLPPGPRRPADVADASNRPPESREDRVWRWSYQSYLQKKDLLVFKETSTSPLQDQYGAQARWNIYTKYYLEDRLDDGIRPRDFLDGVTNEQGAKALIALGMGGIFDFAKPPKLVSKLLTWIADKDALVLDFFAGSGTTAQAVLEQNLVDGGRRNFICVQLDETCGEGTEAARAGYPTIAAIARERIRRAGSAARESERLDIDDLDIGFRAMRVDTTNMTDVLRAADETEQLALSAFEGSVKADRSSEDLLFQVLLDWGLELSMSIEIELVDGTEIITVEGGSVIACFDDHVDPKLVKVIAERQPLRAVFRDSGFDSDASRINAEQVFRELSPSTDIRTI